MAQAVLGSPGPLIAEAMSALCGRAGIGPGDRKSVQPMAEWLAPGDYDQLHHFVAAGVWDAAPLETELLIQADRLVGGSDAVLVIDDTAVPKKGTHSVGVAAQYASALGKTANCQTLVSLDVRPRRSSGDGGIAAFPSRQLGQRSAAAEANWCSGRISNFTDKARRSHWRRLIA